MKPVLFLAVVAGLVLAGCSRAPLPPPEPPKKVVFPIGGYSGDPARDAAAGFTIAGPVYAGQRDGFLAKCEAAGLPLIYTVGVDIDFLGKKGPSPTTLDWEAIRQQVHEQVSAVASNPLIHCWYLTPEELRNWRPLEMEYLKLVSETITAADPQKRPIWMYEPGHRTQPALEKTLPYMSIAGKGVYPGYSRRHRQRIWVPWTIGQQAGAVRAVNPDAAPYAILEMLKRTDESFPDEQIRTWVRHDAYASLVGGVRGIVIFSFGRRAGFHPETPEWKAYYEAWSGVARELNGPEALGSVFLTGTPKAPPAFRVTEGAPTTMLTVDQKKPPVEMPTVSSSAFVWGDREYWCVVNSSEEPVRLAVQQSLKGWQPVLSGQPEAAGTDLRLPALGVAVFYRKLP